jgi:hypothetical protein
VPSRVAVPVPANARIDAGRSRVASCFATLRGSVEGGTGDLDADNVESPATFLKRLQSGPARGACYKAGEAIS